MRRAELIAHVQEEGNEEHEIVGQLQVTPETVPVAQLRDERRRRERDKLHREGGRNETELIMIIQDNAMFVLRCLFEQFSEEINNDMDTEIQFTCVLTLNIVCLRVNYSFSTYHYFNLKA